LGVLGRRIGRIPPTLILAAPPAAAGQDRGLLPWVIALIVILALWQGAMEIAGLSPFFAKRPGDVWQFLAMAPEAAANRLALAQALGQTLILAVPGYLAGLVLGAGLALVLALRPALAVALMPAAIALRSVPIVTTAPLIVLALGRGATGTIAIVAVMIFFPTLVACQNGLRLTPAPVADLFASYAASPWQRLRHAQVPAMLPGLFAAARMAVPAALLAATTTEWLATGIGMGALMALASSTSSYAMLWSATTLLSLVATLGYLGVEGIERATLRRWAPEQLAR
jgi:ABC-type nitrate/sulfonate/bicarbonate transport system permease component